MNDKTTSPEQRFQSSLRDCLAILQGLSHLCKTPAELSEMIELALENEAQNRLIMSAVLGKHR